MGRVARRELPNTNDAQLFSASRKAERDRERRRHGRSGFFCAGMESSKRRGTRTRVDCLDKPRPASGSTLTTGFSYAQLWLDCPDKHQVHRPAQRASSDRKLGRLSSDHHHRDPRGHSVSIAYTTRIDTSAEPKPGSDAESAKRIRDWSSLSLAFNHAEVIADAESLIQSHWA
jgi:hypothetical protein